MSFAVNADAAVHASGSGSAGGGAATSATTGHELSLEEALAFFDGYDDHALLHTPRATAAASATNHNVLGVGGAAGGNAAAAFAHHQQQQQQFQQQQLQYQQQQQQYQLHQQQQQQQLLHLRQQLGQHTHHGGNMAMTTDVLMMMDDASAEEFIAHDAFLGGHSGVPDMNVDMSGGGVDFGMMASMLQPLHLDDSLLLSSPVTEVPTTETPMQTLLTTPLAPTEVVKPTTATTTTAMKKARGAKAENNSPKVRQSAKAKASGASSSSSSSPPKAPTAAASSTALLPKTAATGSNSTSTKRVRRQKEELLYLRTKVVELEERLQQLKRVNGETSSTRGSPAPSSSDDAAASSSSSPVRAATTSASTPASTPTTNSSSPSQKNSSNTNNKSRKKPREEDSETDDAEDDSSSPSAISPALLASVWENVAERQYKERLRAEQQNKKLKTMLEGQIKLATSLEKILKKRPNMEVLYPDTENKPPKSQRVITYEETDEDIFKKQLEGIEKAYLRVDEVMDAAGFFTSEETRHDFRIKEFPDEDGVLMEFMATTTVPFDLAISGNALWRFMSDVAVKKHCYYEDVIHSTDDTFSRKFGVRLAEGEQNVDLRGKHTLRKFTEKERIVLVWKSLMEPIQLADSKVRGLRFNDVGWIVAQRSEAGGGATLIKAYGHMCPCLPDESEDHQEEQIGALTDFVINCHESNAALCIQLINDLLVEEEWKTTLAVTL